jgi:hypothetical protein
MSVSRPFVVSTGAVILGLTISLSLSPAAKAEGLLEALFGGLSRALSGSGPTRGYAPERDPVARLFDGQQRNSAARTPTIASAPATGTSRGFCVRICDGAHFPVQSRRGFSAAEACSAFCPASSTRVFFGSNIDTATARDGSRYAALDTAHLYQQHLVPGCTCNGKPTGGLASIDTKSDPTLRNGDIVVTAAGPVVYSAARSGVANFTPVDATRLPPRERNKLAGMTFASGNAEDEAGPTNNVTANTPELSPDDIGLRR